MLKFLKKCFQVAQGRLRIPGLDSKHVFGSSRVSLRSFFLVNNGHVIHLTWIGTHVQFNQKKSPNIYKSCPKLISLEKLKILSPLQKLLKNVGDLGKLIVAKGFKKLP